MNEAILVIQILIATFTLVFGLFIFFKEICQSLIRRESDFFEHLLHIIFGLIIILLSMSMHFITYNGLTEIQREDTCLNNGYEKYEEISDTTYQCYNYVLEENSNKAIKQYESIIRRGDVE